MKPDRYYEYDKDSNTTYIYDEPMVDGSQSVSVLFDTTPEQARKLYPRMTLRLVWKSPNKS